MNSLYVKCTCCIRLREFTLGAHTLKISACTLKVYYAHSIDSLCTANSHCSVTEGQRDTDAPHLPQVSCGLRLWNASMTISQTQSHKSDFGVQLWRKKNKQQSTDSGRLGWQANGQLASTSNKNSKQSAVVGGGGRWTWRQICADTSPQFKLQKTRVAMSKQRLCSSTIRSRHKKTVEAAA